MEKWRIIGLTGMILGIILIFVDMIFKDIPYAVIIPLYALFIILIFTGLILRKIDMNKKKK